MPVRLFCFEFISFILKYFAAQLSSRIKSIMIGLFFTVVAVVVSVSTSDIEITYRRQGSKCSVLRAFDRNNNFTYFSLGAGNFFSPDLTEFGFEF